MIKKLSMRELWSKYQVIFIFVGMIIVYSIISPDFLTPENIKNVFLQNAALIIICLAQFLAIVNGGVDLSVSAVLAFSGVLSAKLITDMNYNFWLAMAIAVVASGCIGLLNGALIAYFDFSPVIATLATASIAKGINYTICSARTIFLTNDTVDFFGMGAIAGIPTLVVCALALAIILSIIMRYTTVGRRLYAVGGNNEAARLAGINVKSHKVLTYTAAGAIAGIAGVLAAARLGSGAPTTGLEWEMDSIAAVVVGGASLAGGTGTVLNTVLGAFIIGWIKNIMNLLGVPSYPQYIVKGVIIVLAVMSQKFGEGISSFKSFISIKKAKG